MTRRLERLGLFMPRKARVEFPGAVYHILDREIGEQRPF